MVVKVKLSHEGREYLHFPVSGLPDPLEGPMEILFPPSTDWVEMEWVISVDEVWEVWDGVTGLPTHARILVAGPDVDVGSGVALASGTTLPQLRLTSDPEIIVRVSPASIVVSST